LLPLNNSHCCRSARYRTDMDQISDEWRKKRMSELADRMGGKAALGRMLGYKDGAFVRQMIAGERPITEKTIRAVHEKPGLAGWFSVVPAQVASLSDLAGAEEPIRVHVLSNAGSMGQGNDMIHDDVMVGTIALSPEWVSKRIRPTAIDSLRFVHAYGDSMSPTFVDGDILLVDTGAINPSGADGVYVLETHHRLFIKRVTERFDGGFDVTSDNPGVKTVGELNGDNEVHVKGRVVWVWNGKKL
jgi:hypothetical protein